MRSPSTYANASLFSDSHLIWRTSTTLFLSAFLRYIDDIHPVSSGFSGGFLTGTPILNMLGFLSFFCAVCLAVFISVQRIRTSVPRLSIILWLFGYNLVHGINALVWSGNVDIHAPVWCDIVTNFMLGANLAVPAAFSCVSRQLELLSSTRTISFHPTVIRNQLILDIFMCYLLPIIYILLHLVVQNHRFDLVENLGCSASVDSSAVGISLVWIPPLLICSISIVFFALSIRNALRHCSGRLSIHLESRSTMNSSSFYRCLVISMTTTIAAGLIVLLSSFSGPSLHPWSWATVHASMSEVHIVSSQDQLGSIQLAWWGGFVVTVLYLVLSYCLGEETRDIYNWIRQKTAREERFVLPMHGSKNTKIRRLTLKSGWDEMLDDKVSKAKIKSPITIPICSSPAPTITVEDEVFKTSTCSYLASSTAKTLGLSGPPVPQNVAEIPKPRTPSPVSPTVHKAADNPLYAPPNSPLPSIPASCHVSRSRSPSNLPSEETFAHPL